MGIFKAEFLEEGQRKITKLTEIGIYRRHHGEC